MNRFRKTLLVSGMYLAALTVPTFAVGPTEVVVSTPQRIATYSAAILGLAPAASATDFVTLTGSATMVVRVKMIECSGTTTASASIPLQLVRRSTADTTGTSTSPSVVPHDTNSAAGTAVMKAYTVNPGALGTIVGGPIRTEVLSTPALATSTINGGPPLSWTFGNLVNDQEITLRGVAQTLAINANAASFAAGAAINCDIEFTESAS